MRQTPIITVFDCGENLIINKNGDQKPNKTGRYRKAI